MAYTITDKCLTCGMCIFECPADAISPEVHKYIIDPDKCMDCGSCVGACIPEAIHPGE